VPVSNQRNPVIASQARMSAPALNENLIGVRPATSRVRLKAIAARMVQAALAVKTPEGIWAKDRTSGRR